MIIRFAGTADRDLDEIKAFIADDSPASADRVVARILQSIRYLGDFPLLGRPGLVPATRELMIAGLPYKAVYRIDGDVVLVVNIIHTRRNWP